MNENLLITTIFLICFFLVVLNSIIIFFTYKSYKFYPNQRDSFIYKKNFYLFIFAIFSIIFKIYENEKFVKNYYLYLSNYFYCFFTFYNFFIINEEYLLIVNPFYNFVNIFDKKFKSHKKEFIIGIFIVIFMIINEFINIKINLNFNCFLKENLFTLFLSFIINLINIIYIIKTILFLKKIQNTSKQKIQIILILDFLLILFNLFYNSLIITLIITSLMKINFLTKKTFLIEILFPFSFYFDTFIQILCTKNTDFFYYFFAEEDFSCLFKIFCLFNNYYKRPLFNISSFFSSNRSSISSENEEDLKKKSIKNNLIINDKKIEKDSILINFILKKKFNSIFILNLEICEYFLNLSLCSIYKIFKKIIYEKQTQNDISTFNNENNLHEIFINDKINNNKIKKNFLNFNYNLDSFNDFDYKNNFLLFNNYTFEINKKYSNDFKINIKYLFYDEFEKIINDFNINLEEIIESLISHQNFPFLIAKNSKEEEFQFLNNFQLKSNDFKIIIYIYNNIFEEKTNNKKINDYFNYLNLNKNTFLPKIFAIFNIKINNFNSFTLILGKNPIFDNIPKQIFNYWQIMKFNKFRNDFYKIITSKDRNSICIFEDNLLNGINKLLIKDFENFKLLLENDLNFLKNINSKNFEFYLIYYEIDQNNNDNNNENNNNKKENKLKNSQNSNFLFLNRLSNLSIERESNVNQIRNTKISINFRTSEINNTLSNAENDFFDNNNNNESLYLNDEIIENLETNIVINTKKIINNQDGFECLFNEYKCLIFCTFENIFDFNNINNSKNNKNYYLKFKNNLLNNFEQIKK